MLTLGDPDLRPLLPAPHSQRWLSQVMFMSRSLRLQSDKNPSTDVLPTGVPAPLHQEDGDKVAACPIYCFFFPLAQHKN